MVLVLKPESIGYNRGDKNINEVTQLTIKGSTRFLWAATVNRAGTSDWCSNFEGNQCSSWIPQ